MIRETYKRCRAGAPGQVWEALLYGITVKTTLGSFIFKIVYYKYVGSLTICFYSLFISRFG